MKSTKKEFSLFNLSIISNHESKHVISYIDDGVKAPDKSDDSDPYSFQFHQALLVVMIMAVWGMANWFFVKFSWDRYYSGNLVNGVILFIFVTHANAYCIRYLCKNHRTIPVWLEMTLSLLSVILLLFFSLSWHYAKLGKRAFAKDREKTTRKDTRIDNVTLFIAYSNRSNLLISALFAGLILLTSPLWSGQEVLLIFMVLRTLSRSFEITLAFGKDAIDKKIKSSVLGAKDRLMLAFTSLIECVINYTISYYAISVITNGPICKWQAFVHSFQTTLFYTNSILNDSLWDSAPTALSLLQVTQVITCITLVLVAFAMYISNTKSERNG